ncbi:MFS transporter [Maribacter vaceletii]|uniref:MFS transporter n=1 Tax=Maribacter vaceletii TaxID=1206816 RepID=A0A495E9A8_9FLAO|nr:MFS transporter [Maribacter vaceletii]RKR13508.1 MFS transporter [Maribacter vaceletii]
MPIKRHILPSIIFAQFAGTSLWFAGNAIIEPLILKTGLGTEIMSYVLSSVQFGFIIGTLVFSLLMLADRFSPSRVFMLSAVLAAICNFSLLTDTISQWHLLFARFGTGFFLAGIYPVGMKIASDYYKEGLGKALGYLVGALVFGTSFPYLMDSFIPPGDYHIIIKTTSLLAVFGGILIDFWVPNGPFCKPISKLKFKEAKGLLKIKSFKKAAIGYFGHMWELYAFWAFTPLAIKTYNQINKQAFQVSLTTGIIIALGGIACIGGGFISQRFGSYKVAFYSLVVSGLFCIVSPLLFELPVYLFIFGWAIWGMAVVADSPQFSNQVTMAVPIHLKATALTITNCIGFTVSILSIQLLSYLTTIFSVNYIYVFLAIGPVVGVLSFIQKAKKGN